MVVVARIVFQTEPERYEDGDMALVDAEGRLQIIGRSGEVIDTIEAGDWIDAQANDGQVLIPPDAF